MRSYTADSMKAPSPRGLAVIAGALLLFLITPAAVGQNTVIPLTTRRDMVFDHAGKYLYVSTADGFVRRYNIAAAQVDAEYNLGGSLLGMDISPDDSFLLVAQDKATSTQGTIHRLDLGTGSMTNITYTRTASEAAAWDVKIAANGTAFFTTHDTGYSGTLQVPLRQIDLATNAIKVRTDAPGSGSNGLLRGSTAIYRNASGTRLFLLEYYGQEVSFTYDSATDSFGSRAYRDTASPSDAMGAVDRTGSIVATSRAWKTCLDTAPDFRFLRQLSIYPTGGIAFHPTQDLLYVVTSGTYPGSRILAIDTNTYAEVHRVDIAESGFSYEQFFFGGLVASHNGEYLALSTNSGIHLIKTTGLPVSPAPAPVFGSTSDVVFDHAGRYLYAASNGYLWPYNLATQTFERPYELHGGGGWIDITPDDAFVLTSGGYGLAEGRFINLNLATGATTNFDYPRARYEGGPGPLAIGSSGIALAVTHGTSLDASRPSLRDVNLATGEISVRTDAPTYSNNGAFRGEVRRTPDGKQIYLANGERQFTYDATTNSFGPPSFGNELSFLTSPPDIAVNRDGSIAVTVGFNFNAYPAFWYGLRAHTTSSFAPLADLKVASSGVAFDAVSDTLYVLSFYLGQIVAYDTKTFQERFRFDTGTRVYPFDRAGLVASNDGRYLALRRAAGVRCVPSRWNRPAPERRLVEVSRSRRVGDQVAVRRSAVRRIPTRRK